MDSFTNVDSSAGTLPTNAPLAYQGLNTLTPLEYTSPVPAAPKSNDESPTVQTSPISDAAEYPTEMDVEDGMVGTPSSGDTFHETFQQAMRSPNRILENVRDTYDEQQSTPLEDDITIPLQDLDALVCLGRLINYSVSF
jgi:hypothetical protein